MINPKIFPPRPANVTVPPEVVADLLNAVA
jgi:hypothetical protein